MAVPVIWSEIQVIEATIGVMDVPGELAYGRVDTDDSHPITFPRFVAFWVQGQMRRP